jgi:FlaA1/EpsC-like NDP-sugar epimerase
MAQLRNRHLLLIDAVLLPVAAWLSFAIRFEGGSWPVGMLPVFIVFVVLAVPAKLAMLVWSGMYGRLWRYASIHDLAVLCRGAALAFLAGALVGLVIVPAVPTMAQRVPLSSVALDALLAALLLGALRLFLRVGRRWRSSTTTAPSTDASCTGFRLRGRSRTWPPSPRGTAPTRSSSRSRALPGASCARW